MGLFLKTTIQIYLLNACNLDWGDNFFDFYVESKTSKIKMLINMWSPDLQVQLITLLNTFVCDSIPLMKGPDFWSKNEWQDKNST